MAYLLLLLVVFWALGVLSRVGGAFIHLLLFIALVIFIFNYLNPSKH